MKPLIHDVGMDEYQGVKEAQEKAKRLLQELADVKAYIEKHQAGAEWLRLEDKDKFDATQKAVDEVLESYAPGALEKIVAGPQAIAEYERIVKNPLFYDASCKQWNWYTSKDGELQKDSTLRMSCIQLEGITALALTANKEKAAKVYDSLLETQLRDKQRNQWKKSMNAAQQLKYSDRNSTMQLSGITALASIGRMKKANEEYDALLETPLWDRQRKQWNLVMDCSQQLNSNDNSTNRAAQDQLLGVFALASLGRMKEANEVYDLLLESPLRDREGKRWGSDMDATQQKYNSSIYSVTQLAGVIALALIGRIKEANEEYDALLKTPLYNQGQWATEMNTKGKITNDFTGPFIYLTNIIALAALGR